MAMPNNVDASPAPTYIIYRDVPQGELYDPTAPLAFFPPKDSDELFDALRAKYPHLKSHSERMRDATIEFLLEERQAESMSATVSPAMPSLYESVTDQSPWQQSWPSASMTTLSSPDMTNFATPALESSPKQVPPMTRQQSAAGSSSSQTPAIDQMTSVFSLSSVEQPKQRVRRKMTEAEKVEYRKRRIVKACDKCSKRKRKCIHNQPEMENLKAGNDSSEHKVAKPRTKLTKPTHHVKPAFSSFDSQVTSLSDLFTADELTGGYEDFTLMMDEPTLDFGFKDFTSFDQPQFFDQQQLFVPEDNLRQCTQQHFNIGATSASPLGTSQDWTLLDHTDSDNLSGHTQSFEASDSGLGLRVPHSSQLLGSPQSPRRCDPTHTRPESVRAIHGNTYNTSHSESPEESFSLEASCPQDGLGALRQSARASEGRLSTFVLDSGFEEESPGKNSENASSLLRRGNSHGTLAAPAAMDLTTAASGANATQSTAPRRRHRLRSGGTAGATPQSELSSTSAISSSSFSRPENAAALEGRPIASDVQPALRRTPQNGLNASESMPASSTLQSRSRATPEVRVPATQQQSRISLAGLNASESTPASSTLQSRTRATQETCAAAMQQQSRVPSKSSSALLARPSPFDENANSPARSTELFRLKNRIPASLEILCTPSSLRAPTTVGLATQANGGAEPSVQVSRGQGTRAQTQLVSAAQLTTSPSASTEASDLRKTFTESDTRRYKDHHGRTSDVYLASTLPSSTLLVNIACVALGVALLAAVSASASSFAATTSMVALALLAPISTASKHSLWSTNSSVLRRQMQSRLRKHRASPNLLCALDYAQSVGV